MRQTGGWLLEVIPKWSGGCCSFPWPSSSRCWWLVNWCRLRCWCCSSCSGACPCNSYRLLERLLLLAHRLNQSSAHNSTSCLKKCFLLSWDNDTVVRFVSGGLLSTYILCKLILLLSGGALMPSCPFWIVLMLFNSFIFDFFLVILNFWGSGTCSLISIVRLLLSGCSFLLIWGGWLGSKILHSSVPLSLKDIFFNWGWFRPVLGLLADWNVLFSCVNIKYSFAVRALHCGGLQTPCFFYNLWFEMLVISNLSHLNH